MIDPVVFANINSFAVPAFAHHRNEGVDVLEHQINTDHRNPSESSRINAYTSSSSARNEGPPQLADMFSDAFKPEEQMNQPMEENTSTHNDNTCTDCGKTFNERSFLLRHRIAHAEAKYICHICSRAFVRDDKLKRHIRCVHSHERPFVCEICAKAFARKDKLQEHARHHNRDITFTCPVCSDVFVMRSHLNRHLRSVHQIKQAINASNSSSSTASRNSPAGDNLSVPSVNNDECSGQVRMEPDSDGLDSGIAVDQMSSFSGNSLTHEKMKPTRSRPAVKRTRKKPTDSCLPAVGKHFSLSGSPQLSAFSVPTPLLPNSSGATVYATDNRLAPTECLPVPPMLQFAQTQPQQQYQFQQQQQQQVALQMRQRQQQQQAYNSSTDMQATYFTQQQHLQQQQQNQSSAFSAAMAASLFSPVNYVGWWPQANPSLMLQQSQQNSPYSNLTGASAHNHQTQGGASFLPNNSSTAVYPGNQPDCILQQQQQQQRVHQLAARQQVIPPQGLTTAASVGNTAQYTLQDSDLVRPDAAAAAQAFASLPPLAQAVYYQAATLAATQNSASSAAAAPQIAGAYGASRFDPNAGNQFAGSPSGAFQLSANGPVTN